MQFGPNLGAASSNSNCWIRSHHQLIKQHYKCAGTITDLATTATPHECGEIARTQCTSGGHFHLNSFTGDCACCGDGISNVVAAKDDATAGDYNIYQIGALVTGSELRFRQKDKICEKHHVIATVPRPGMTLASCRAMSLSTT
jgi:hypothetical protein